MHHDKILVYTVGFTKKTAAEFFEKLRSAGIKRVVDVRLNNVSQLAGFSKRDDLRYFVKQILGVDYVAAPLLAPTQELLDAYKKNKGRWEDYERAFLSLMEERHIEDKIDPALLAGGCLLCSEGSRTNATVVWWSNTFSAAGEISTLNISYKASNVLK